MLSLPMVKNPPEQDRASFYLPISEAEIRKVPLMPDQDYSWLADEGWRAANDALFPH